MCTMYIHIVNTDDYLFSRKSTRSVLGRIKLLKKIYSSTIIIFYQVLEINLNFGPSFLFLFDFIRPKICCAELNVKINLVECKVLNKISYNIHKHVFIRLPIKNTVCCSFVNLFFSCERGNAKKKFEHNGKSPRQYIVLGGGEGVKRPLTL